MGKTKRLTSVTAGRLVSAVIYTQATAADDERTRAQKAKISSEARQQLNRRLSWQKLETLLAANFDRGDLWVTLTYDDEHVPRSRTAALQCLEKFLRALRAARRSAGDELRYVKNVESVTRDGEPTRLHHHLVINGTGRDYDLIRALWPYGAEIEIEPFGRDGESYTDIAKYMSKERPPVGQNSWTPSRNLNKPRRESEMVDDALTLAPPPGATVLDRREEHNGWGEYVYLKYLLPYRPRVGKTRRKRE